MKLQALFAHLHTPSAGIAGIFATTPRPRVQQYLVSGVRMADVPVNKPPYVSASERCP